MEKHQVCLLNIQHGMTNISRRLKTMLSYKWIKSTLRDSFFNNSLSIMLSSAISSALGLIFWIIAGRTYSGEDIGVATAIISSVTLIIAISKLGLDQSMIRFYPTEAKSRIFNTVIVTTSLVSLVIGIIFVAGIDFFSPNLKIINDMVVIFLAFTVISSMASIVTNAFVSMRSAKYGLVQNIAMGSRLFLLFPLSFLGTLGIITSVLLAYVLAIIVCIVILISKGLRPEKLDFSFLKRSWDFSAGNYIVVLLTTIPTSVLPILVFNQFGAEDTAIYYIVFSFASILFLIPSACSTALFVEGSHGESINKIVKKSIITSYCLLVPALFVIVATGDRLLGIVGTEYVKGGFELLKLMAISSFFVVFFHNSISVWKVNMNLREMILLSLLNCILLLLLSYILMKSMGLIGIGVAWIVGYGISIAAILVIQRFFHPRTAPH